MNIKSSMTLRNYEVISNLAHKTEEPIYLTKNGEGDLIVMSIDAFEGQEKMIEHRAKIFDAEISRLSGEPTYTIEQIRNHLKEIHY